MTIVREMQLLYDNDRLHLLVMLTKNLLVHALQKIKVHYPCKSKSTDRSAVLAEDRTKQKRFSAAV